MLTLLLLCLLAGVSSQAGAQQLFREYIGAEGNNVKFSDVPIINDALEFHFILSFAVDYTTSGSPTNGVFQPFWDTANLDPSHVSSIKSRHPNLKVAVSLGGDTVVDGNAIRTVTKIVEDYNLDGIDIDYEHFGSDVDTDTFAECIGRLLQSLKSQNVIKFASIAPFDDDNVQRYWINNRTDVGKFLKFYDEQSSNYKGGKVLVSFATDDSGGLKPEGGFFKACSELKRKNKLHGIFIWSADDSKKLKFKPEIQSQNFLLSSAK
ncbi:Chitinase 1 [Linum grandiflorum]